MTLHIKRNKLRPFIVVLASVIYAINIRVFVKVGGLYPGGATGLTILVQTILERFFNLNISYTAISIACNAIPVYIGFRYIGKKFTGYSLIIILLSGFLVDIIPSMGITYDLHQRICHCPVSVLQCHYRRNRLHLYLSFPEVQH